MSGISRSSRHPVTRKLCCHNDDRAIPLYIGALKNFGGPWLVTMAMATFPKCFTGFFFAFDRMNICTEYEVHSFTRSWDKRGYPKNLDSPWICPHCISRKFSVGFHSDGPCECTCHSASRGKNWRIMELSLLRTFAPGSESTMVWNFRSLELLFPGTFAPGSECSRERKFLGAKVLGTFAPGSESSKERKFLLPNWQQTQFANSLPWPTQPQCVNCYENADL